MNHAEIKHLIPAVLEGDRLAAAQDAYEQWERAYAVLTSLAEGLQMTDKAAGNSTQERWLAEVAAQELEKLREKMVDAFGPCGAGLNSLQVANKGHGPLTE